MNKQKVVLFDIDYTLFDTTKFKELVAEILSKDIPLMSAEKIFNLIDETWQDLRKTNQYNPKYFPEMFEKKLNGNKIDQKLFEKIWYDQSLIVKCIYPEVLSVLEKIEKVENIKVGIFSAGLDMLQKAKISALENFFHKEHIHVVVSKQENINMIAEKYKESDLFVVDDFLEILEIIKEKKSDTKTIWVKRGKIALNTVSNFIPDYAVDSIDTVPVIIAG